MGFTIATNTSSLNAMRNLTLNQTAQSKAVERLSSGLRINRAADDAAGLAISEGLKNQISGLTQANRNAQDGISLIQTAEGALTEVHSILNRMRDLAVQSANDTNNGGSQAAIQKEVDALNDELTRITTTTNFNGINLLDASAGSAGNGKIQFQVGAASTDIIEVELTDVNAIVGTTAGDATVTPAIPGGKVLDLNLGQVDGTGATTATATTRAAAIVALDTAIEGVSGARADLGAVQNRLESTSRSISVSIENLSAANSRIRDTDMATEMASFTKSQILSSAATAMLAQANQMNSGVMQLLQ